jgi:hypothetical protein
MVSVETSVWLGILPNPADLITSSCDDLLKVGVFVCFAEVHPKRFIYYRGQTLALTIESSFRPAHMLITRVFATFLREVLGFAYVEINDRDDRFNATIAIEGLHNPLEHNVL